LESAGLWKFATQIWASFVRFCSFTTGIFRMLPWK